MKNIIKNIAVVTFAITVPTAASLAVMGAIVSGISTVGTNQEYPATGVAPGISQTTIQQSQVK